MWGLGWTWAGRWTTTGEVSHRDTASSWALCRYQTLICKKRKFFFFCLYPSHLDRVQEFACIFRCARPSSVQLSHATDVQKMFLFWETRSSSLWTLCIVDSYTLMQLSSLRNQQNGAFNKEVIDRFVMSIKHYAVRIINSRLRSD